MHQDIIADSDPSRALRMRPIRAIALAIAVASLVSLALFAFSALSGAVSDADTVVARVRAADAAGAFSWDSHRKQDYFSECAAITMNITRPASAWRNAIETHFDNSQEVHSCDALRLLASRTTVGEPPRALYMNYAFGARYLMAIGLRFLDVARLRSLYSGLWVLAVIALFGALAVRLRADALAL